MPSSRGAQELAISSQPPALDTDKFESNEIPSFSFTDFVPEKLLGIGSFAAVHQVQLKPGLVGRIPIPADEGCRNISSYALKSPKRSEGDNVDDSNVTFDEKIKYLEIEAQFLARLDHPNIIHLRGTSNGKCSFLGYFIVLDCLRKDTLKDRLNIWRQSNKLSRPSRPEEKPNCEQRIRRIGLGVVAAMKYLHSKSIIFRDLKVSLLFRTCCARKFPRSVGAVRVLPKLGCRA
jgi:serine/threonine protein kinase